MLLVYLDEAGIGDAKNEKYVVVAGVIVEDTQYKSVEKRIQEVRDEHVPKEHRKDFVFHASDMFGGSEKKISREEFPLEKRRDALEDLIKIIPEQNLPVVQGFFERAMLKNIPQMSAQDQVVYAQSIASTICLITVEAFTQQFAQSSTLALMVYENNDQCKKTVKVQHAEFKKPETLHKVVSAAQLEQVQHLIPLRRVIDTAHFAEKSEAPLLQLADVCAYFIKRRLMDRMDSMRYLKHILNQLTSNAHGLWSTAPEEREAT